MAFYPARCSVSYTPSDGTDEAVLCRAGEDMFFALPEFAWDLPTDQRAFCASVWGEAVPIGNARAQLTLSILYEAPTLAQVLLYMRDREYLLAQHRAGTLTIDEAYDLNVPALRTTWKAVVTGINPQPLLTMDDALGNPDHPAGSLRGMANARLQLQFTLTEPQTSRVFPL